MFLRKPRKSDTPFGLLIRCAPWLAAGVAGALVCATSRRRAAWRATGSATRAARNEARLDAIIRSAMESIIVIDDAQRIVIFNPMAERVFGCAACDGLGTRIERFIPERFRAAHAGHVARFGATGQSDRRMGGQRRLFGRRVNGEEFPLEASISQVTGGGGRLYTVILRDVSERVRAEQALQASREELEQLSANSPGHAPARTGPHRA